MSEDRTWRAWRARALNAEEVVRRVEAERDASLALVLKAYQFNNQQDLGVPADWDEWQSEAKSMLTPKEPTK